MFVISIVALMIHSRHTLSLSQLPAQDQLRILVYSIVHSATIWLLEYAFLDSPSSALVAALVKPAVPILIALMEQFYLKKTTGDGNGYPFQLYAMLFAIFVSTWVAYGGASGNVGYAFAHSTHRLAIALAVVLVAARILMAYRLQVGNTNLSPMEFLMRASPLIFVQLAFAAHFSGELPHLRSALGEGKMVVNWPYFGSFVIFSGLVSFVAHAISLSAIRSAGAVFLGALSTSVKPVAVIVLARLVPDIPVPESVPIGAMNLTGVISLVSLVSSVLWLSKINVSPDQNLDTGMPIPVGYR